MPATVTIKCENCPTSITGEPDEALEDVKEVALDAGWFTRFGRFWWCQEHPPSGEPRLVGNVQECHSDCLHFAWPTEIGETPKCRIGKRPTVEGAPCRPWVLRMVKDLEPFNNRAAREAEMDL